MITSSTWVKENCTRGGGCGNCEAVEVAFFELVFALGLVALFVVVLAWATASDEGVAATAVVVRLVAEGEAINDTFITVVVVLLALFVVVVLGALCVLTTLPLDDALMVVFTAMFVAVAAELAVALVLFAALLLSG